MTERLTHLKLAVHLGSDPITGSVTGEIGEAKSFCGWIELVAAIEAARSGRGLLPESAPAERSEEEKSGVVPWGEARDGEIASHHRHTACH